MNSTLRAKLIVHGQGRVTPAALRYAHDKISSLTKLVAEPILFAKVDLVAYADPARERPALAKAEVDVNGRVIHAHAEAQTMRAAVDELEARLRTRLSRRARRR